MNKSPQVSVIIPVYNLEKYISACLDSIKNQTYTDYEVIIIDDGSTDNSALIISEFIKKNSLGNFTLLNQRNKGLSSARNLGIDRATGKWITFVDGDDFVESDFLSSMCRQMEETAADLCYCGYCAFYEDLKETENWSDFDDYSGKLPDNIDKLCSFGYVWAHLYSMEIITKNSLCFDEDIFCEDAAFNLDYNSVISSFCSVGDVKYNYRINRSDALTMRPVHPREKKRLAVHIDKFKASISEQELLFGIQNSVRLSRVMWNGLYTDAINGIIDGNTKAVRAARKTTLLRTVAGSYKPRLRKDRLFLVLWKNAFWALVLLVKIYYSNFEKIRRSKVGSYMSGE